jgi:acylphosphatase
LSSVIRVCVVVRGRVQGVWFRDSCQTRAREEGVAGFVRNCDDGSVVAEFEGPEPAVARMIAWCREGPPRARVDDVQVEAIPTTNTPGFHVR